MPAGKKHPPGALELALVDVIRGHMTRDDVTQNALAEAAGISPAQISRIIGGQKPMTVTELDRIGSRLGLSLALLMAEAETLLDIDGGRSGDGDDVHGSGDDSDPAKRGGVIAGRQGSST